MNYKLAVFDFDGTLADSFPWVLSIQNQVAQKFDLPAVKRSEVERYRGLDIKEVLAGTGLSPWKVARVGRYARRLMGEQIGQIPLFAGIDHLLVRLARKGVTLAVVSSNSRDNVCGVLGPVNSACFSYFECGVSLFGKATKLRKVLRQSGTPPAEAIMIGDEVRDLVAAHAAHMAAGAVTWGFNHRAALQAHHPDLIFSRVEEIGEALV
jgi:phosphoglycolate phosphatase